MPSQARKKFVTVYQWHAKQTEGEMEILGYINYGIFINQ